MGAQSITIEINPDGLAGVSDKTLAAYWHVAQLNPADGFETSEPGELVAKIGYEIIRRWLRGQEPSLHHHQDRHYYWHQLGRFARWDGETGEWVPRDPAGEQQAG